MNVRVNLGLSALSEAELCEIAIFYCNTMGLSSYFTATHIVTHIGIVTTSAGNLRTAIDAPYSPTKTDDVKKFRDILEKNVTKLGSLVENIANDPAVDEDDRITIVHAAGMKVKVHYNQQKHHFKAENGEISGTILITAQGGANAHEWKYTSSTDNHTTFEHLRGTTVAKQEIKGLAKGIEIAIYHSKIDKDSPHEWEGPIYIMVT